jgi:transcriptional regulator with XRE-family HTH domain
MENITVTEDDLPSRLRRVLDKTPATQEDIARRAGVSLKWVNTVKNAPPGKTFDPGASDKLRRALDEYVAEHLVDIAGLVEETYEPGSEIDDALDRIAKRRARRR